MTLSYVIKNNNTVLLRHVLKKIYIIFQVPATDKPKYVRAILRQMLIFDIKAVNLIFQKTYLANELENLEQKLQIFMR